jgi:tetrahydromethanopterin S-methyltransferase subunit G
MGNLINDKDLFERVLDRLDSIDERLNNVDKTLVKQEMNLDEHMKRSDSLETMINHVKMDLEPVESHVKNVNLILKIIGILGSSICAIYYAIEIYKH